MDEEVVVGSLSSARGPVVTVLRGFGRLAGAARRWWSRAPRDRRGPVVLLCVAAAVLVALLPYAVWGAAAGTVAAAAFQGRRAEAAEREEQALAGRRLQTVYEALVPCFSSGDFSAEPLYACGGEWERGVEAYAFTREGRIARLLLRYPACFPDGDAACRDRVERVLAAKAGRDREVVFHWSEERNRLEMTALEPLPTGICAQRFVAGPGETVLGFTDAESVDRTVPVCMGADGEPADASPVVWRTGARSPEPHLLVVGAPGAGATSLLRSVALQAVREGEVLLVDGSGAGEFGCFAGREGVVAVEAAPGGALAALEWAARETERRLLAAGGGNGGEGAAGRGGSGLRPLWIVVDRPVLLGHLARMAGARDPLEVLEVPLRLGRAAQVTVVLAEQFEDLDGLGGTVPVCTRARVVLGAAEAEQMADVLGSAPGSAPAPGMPAGRGFVRLGTGPVHRVQVPATPDPGDEAAAEWQRQAVQALLPERAGAAGAARETG